MEMSNLSKIDPDTLVLLGAFIAVLISQNLSSDEMSILGSFLQEIGGCLSTKATQQEFIKARQEELKKQIEELESQLKKLKQQLY